MKYSFIVATYNRIDELQELIPSLEELKFDSSQFELVIVDDGSTDGTEEYISRVRTKFPIQYLKQKNQGPGAARNKGMQHAKGSYFIFIDSDCFLPQEYLIAVESELQKENFDAFGGPDTYHPSFSPLLKAINYSMTSFLGTGGTRGSKKSIGRYYPRSFNMGIRREIFTNIGGMNALRHGQDMDFSVRIYEAGYKVGYIHEAFVYHKRRTGIWKFFKQIHNWGVARINLGNAYPQLWKPIHFAPALVLIGTILVPIVACFIPLLRPLLNLMMIGIMGVALLAFVQSLVKYKNLKVALLSIMTLFIQVYAYGIGLINALYQTKIKNRKEAKGITKNYYK